MRSKTRETSGNRDFTQSPKPTSLSPKQAEVLGFIRAEIDRSGRPPTYRDIGKAFGTAASTIEDHLRALIRKGYLEKEPGVACGLRLPGRASSQSIPLLGSVPAGLPIEAIEDQRGSLSAPTRWKGELYALTVKGESMRDAGILDGDIVIVRKQSDAQSGEIVVALIDGEATVKTLEKRSGRVRLLPANPSFSPIELEPGRENLIQGKVVGLQRDYEGR